MPPMIEPGNSRKDFHLSQSVQNVKDILAEVNMLDQEASSQVEFPASGDQSQVQMMPQDEARSENDIGFMTEIDAEYVAKLPTGKISQIETDQVNSTRHSDEQATSMPMNPSTRMLVHDERAEFSQVVKELVRKDQGNALQLEEKILEKVRKRNLSKGWDRPSGVKVAPLKVLQSMQ